MELLLTGPVEWSGTHPDRNADGMYPGQNAIVLDLPVDEGRTNAETAELAAAECYSICRTNGYRFMGLTNSHVPPNLNNWWGYAFRDPGVPQCHNSYQEKVRFLIQSVPFVCCDDSVLRSD